MDINDYRLENGYVLKYNECLILGDACAPAMIIKKQPNGKYAVLGVSEIIAYPGLVRCENKLLNKDFKHAYVLDNNLASSYLIVEDDNGWSTLRVDGDIRCYGGVVSTVTHHPYRSPLQMLLDCGFKFENAPYGNSIHIAPPVLHDNMDYEHHIVCNGITPDNILQLRLCDVFVFGSNSDGAHMGGAARVARKYFGAIMGVGEGMQGQSYAIPTMGGNIKSIMPHVDKFIEFAKIHPEKQFFVTRIGCGIAGYTDAQMAPLFKEALGLKNINIPKSFLNIISM